MNENHHVFINLHTLKVWITWPFRFSLALLRSTVYPITTKSPIFHWTTSRSVAYIHVHIQWCVVCSESNILTRWCQIFGSHIGASLWLGEEKISSWYAFNLRTTSIRLTVKVMSGWTTSRPMITWMSLSMLWFMCLPFGIFFFLRPIWIMLVNWVGVIFIKSRLFMSSSSFWLVDSQNVE